MSIQFVKSGGRRYFHSVGSGHFHLTIIQNLFLDKKNIVIYPIYVNSIYKIYNSTRTKAVNVCKDGYYDNNRLKCECPSGKMTRFNEPCLLLLLSEKTSYGYELMERLERFGFLNAPPDTAMVYRTLRYLEKEGFVKSKWDTDGAGPAKRNYEITREGFDLLHSWARGIEQKKKSLEKFLVVYRQYFKSSRKRS